MLALFVGYVVLASAACLALVAAAGGRQRRRLVARAARVLLAFDFAAVGCVLVVATSQRLARLELTITFLGVLVGVVCALLVVHAFVAFARRPREPAPPPRADRLHRMAAAPPTLFLYITSTPPGEAPLWVREKWVGLALPLAQRKATPVSVLTSGVLSGPRTLFASVFASIAGRLDRQLGYVVETRLAMAALAGHSPEALAWWQASTPRVMQPRRYFVFQSHVGHVNESKPAG